MKYLIAAAVSFLIIGCSVQKGTNYSNLNREQVRKTGTGKSGKCYQKMKGIDGSIDWYEIICPDDKHSYKLAAKCLTKLGYKLISKNNFRTDNGNALVDFQKKNNLAHGALDEATLYLLIQKYKKRK